MIPEISVCVPTRNHGRYLKQALTSVLTQEFSDFEVVVCDDASKDDTPDVVAGLCDSRLRYIRHSRPVGIPANRNTALAHARGRYIAWLDSDDAYHPDMLRLQRDALRRYVGTAFVHSAFDVVDLNGQKLPDWPAPFDRDVVEKGLDAFRNLVVVNYVTTSTVLVRRQCHDQVGPFAIDVGRSSTDWEMWLRLSLCGDVAYTSLPLASYRIHGCSISAATTASGERMRSDTAVIARVFRENRWRIPDASRLEQQARAAAAVRTLMQTTDLFTAGRPIKAAARLMLAARIAGPRMVSVGDRLSLLLSISTNAEYAYHSRTKAVLGRLHRPIADTYYGQQIAKVATTNPEWTDTLNRIAATVRRVVVPGARIAVVDKCDPTILHRSGRRGVHFPDRRLLAGGYPSGTEAVSHLQKLCRRGITYVVFPRSAFWWLEHYEELHHYLDRYWVCIWSDPDCVIYKTGAHA